MRESDNLCQRREPGSTGAVAGPPGDREFGESKRERRPWWLVPAFFMLTLIASLLAACVGGSGVEEFQATVAPPVGGGVSMGGEALGGNAETTSLAQQVLEEVPGGELAWVGHEVRLAPSEALEHAHEFSFAYAREANHLLRIGSESQELKPGEGTQVSPGTAHRHEAPSGASVFWEVRLAAPGSAPPANVPNARLVFESGPLESIPSNPLAAFVHVLVPPDGETSVHTHPGPEFIYQLSGRIDYENALIGVVEMGPGAVEGIPPEVPVQKRNPFEEDAEFLSWFLVDTGEPFASPARFPAPAARGENVALAEKGARVVGVSSIFGGGSNEGTWGANSAIDGDLSTQWSTDGDGDNAWIEIELPTQTHVTSLGFWTRTMGASAEIFSFRVATDGGAVAGPFKLAGPATAHYFDTDLTAKSLRFEVIETSGGNTGAVEIEIYGEPVP